MTEAKLKSDLLRDLPNLDLSNYDQDAYQANIETVHSIVVNSTLLLTKLPG